MGSNYSVIITTPPSFNLFLWRIRGGGGGGKGGILIFLLKEDAVGLSKGLISILI